MALTLCVMLWAVSGREEELADYEDEVLKLLGAHQARLLIRVRSLEDGPTEVQVLQFPSEAALAAFQQDPQRVALADLRARTIERTEISPVELVTGPES